MVITKKKEKYHPNVGDVVTIDDREPMVVIGIRNYEGAGSCCYNREYILCEENLLRNYMGLVTFDKLKTLKTRIVECKGVNFLDFKKIEDIAPYEIKPVEAFMIRRKEPKTVIIWE